MTATTGNRKSDSYRNTVYTILAKRSGVDIDEITDQTRFVEDLHLDGDDAIDAIIEIANVTGIKLDQFDPSLYFYSEPNIFSIFRRKIPKRPFRVANILSGIEREFR